MKVKRGKSYVTFIDCHIIVIELGQNIYMYILHNIKY